MARTATNPLAPPEGLTAGTVAASETAVDFLEGANYAVVTSRQVLFDLALDFQVPDDLSVAPVYYLPVWVDEDIYELEFTAWMTIAPSTVFPFDDCEAVVTLNDGTTDHTTATIDPAHPSRSLVFANPGAPASGLGRTRLMTVTVQRLAGDDPTLATRLINVRLRANARVASTLPAPGE